MNTALRSAEAPCLRAWRGRPYRETLLLRDGRQVMLRPAHRSDADALHGFFAALSPTSRLRRFHGAINRLPSDVLRAFTTQVAHQHVAVVALADTHDGLNRMVAEARYIVMTEAPDRAEFALTVADDWQGQGLGQALLHRLSRYAATEGLQTLHGQVLAGNEAMLGLLTGMGAQLRSEGSEVQAVLTL